MPQFSLVQFLSHVQLITTPWTAACQALPSFTTSQSMLRFMSIESVMPSNLLILCQPLLLQSSVFPSIRVFSSESFLHSRWPKDCHLIDYIMWASQVAQLVKNCLQFRRAGLIPELGSSPWRRDRLPIPVFLGFPDGSDGKKKKKKKKSTCNAGDLVSIPRLGRSPGGGHSNPLQCSYLEYPHGQRSLAGPYSPHLISLLF